jgi:hypothetical protein
MRTYDDTFSGEKIYPGKVRFPFTTSRWRDGITEAGKGSGIAQ